MFAIACDGFSVVNVYTDYLKLCVLMVEGMSVVVNVMLTITSVMSPPLVQHAGAHGGEVMYFWSGLVLGVSLVS